MVKRFFIFLLYCLFALCVTGILLVVLFPRERISDWVAAMVESRMPGYECTIDDIRYVHPLKIRLYRVTVTNTFQKITVPIDSLLLSFQKAYPVDTVGVSGVLFGGNVEGDIRLDNYRRDGKIEIPNLTVSHIHLADIDMLKTGIDRSMSGYFSFSGRASFIPKRLDSARLTGDMRIRDFTTMLRRPIFAKDKLVFDDVKADAFLSSGVLQLSRGRAEGSLLNGNFSGTLRTAALWQNRMVDLKGDVVPQVDLLAENTKLAEALDIYEQRFDTRAIPFSVTGTLREPEIHFSNAPGIDATGANAGRTN